MRVCLCVCVRARVCVFLCLCVSVCEFACARVRGRYDRDGDGVLDLEEFTALVLPYF